MVYLSFRINRHYEINIYSTLSKEGTNTFASDEMKHVYTAVFSRGVKSFCFVRLKKDDFDQGEGQDIFSSR